MELETERGFASWLSSRFVASHAVYDAATAPSLPCPLPTLRALCGIT